MAYYKLLKKDCAALKLGLENWFKRSRVLSIASMTRYVTWPNDESTELDTSFFRVASDGNDADKDEWEILRKQEMHFIFLPNRCTVQSSRDTVARAICGDVISGTEASLLYPRTC